MTRTRMLALLREVVDDGGMDTFWSDATLLDYLAEGQDEFCECTGYFRDFSTHTLVLATGVTTYAIPERVIEILNIWDGTRRLGKFQEQARGGVQREWSLTDTALQTGLPQAWQTDRQTGSITFDRAPTVAENGVVLTLHTWRYSLSPLDRQSGTITLAGTLQAGDTITATVNGTDFAYATTGAEGTLTAVATALAALIHADTDLTASASGQVISVATADLIENTTTTVLVTGAGATVTAVAVDAYSTEPEIPGRFHNALIEFAAAKAYSMHDAEKQDKLKARDHDSNFELYVRKGKRQFNRYHGEEVYVGTSPAYRT